MIHDLNRTVNAIFEASHRTVRSHSVLTKRSHRVDVIDKLNKQTKIFIGNLISADVDVDRQVAIVKVTGGHLPHNAGKETTKAHLTP
jgi:hypothetical protein